MKRIRQLLLLALLVSIGARFYFSFFVDGFIISFSVIVLTLSLYYYEDINPLILALFVSVISPAMRFFIDYLLLGEFEKVFINVYPDTFFYLTFGLIFFLIRKYMGESYYAKIYIIAFCSDFISNLVELSVRTKLFSLSYEMIQGIILVAVARTIVIIFIIYLATMYKSMFQREEHEKRYKYLLMQSSRFKSEVYFLKKNKDQIERIMKLSHEVYRRTCKTSDLKETTLELTKEIHEVKKDYLRVIQGLEELYFENKSCEEMKLKDLLIILVENTDEVIKQIDSTITISSKCRTDIKIEKHYYLMSILRNLINNSIEAIGSNSGRIYIKTFLDEKFLHIHFLDTGPGIETGNLEYVFNPGFSTKYDDLTGDASRGLGLSLVKDMIEKEFRGNVKIRKKKSDTVFELKLLKEAL